MNIVSETNPPPLGMFGGSTHKWERSLDPFSWDGIPNYARKPAVKGWMAEDWCGNPIGFIPDGYDLDSRKDVGHTLEVVSP